MVFLLILTLSLVCLSVNVFATDEPAPTLDEVISGSQDDQSGGNMVSELEGAADMSDPAVGIESVTSGIKEVASYVIQILSYAVIILLVLRVVLDITYIGLPFVRSFLANGYQGNAQAGAGGAPNSAMTGGMPGFGGIAGMHGAGSMGMGGMQGMNQMNSMNQSVVSNNTSNGSKVQLVSNAAMNAVAAESSIGPDGKAVSPFKMYVKDMIVVLILVPVLLTLAITGALTDLGFFIGSLLVELIEGIGSMIS